MVTACCRNTRSSLMHVTCSCNSMHSRDGAIQDIQQQPDSECERFHWYALVRSMHTSFVVLVEREWQDTVSFYAPGTQLCALGRARAHVRDRDKRRVLCAHRIRERA